MTFRVARARIPLLQMAVVLDWLQHEALGKRSDTSRLTGLDKVVTGILFPGSTGSAGFWYIVQ